VIHLTTGTLFAKINLICNALGDKAGFYFYALSFDLKIFFLKSKDHLSLKKFTIPFLFLTTSFLLFSFILCQEAISEPTNGQIIVDPNTPRWLKYFGGGPFFMTGPGDPEDFLYRGTQNSDGTRNGDQMELINKLKGTGANSIYLQAVRSHGGDGDNTHNPFIDNDPDKGINMAVLNQWETWFAEMDANAIVIYFFFYDDDVDLYPLDGYGELSTEEKNFIDTLVDKFEHHKHLIWCVAEEYQELGIGNPKLHVEKIAEAIYFADDHNHVIGVHQLNGLTFDFPNDQFIDQFAIQFNVNTAGQLHDGMLTAWNNADGKYNLNMSECANYGTGETARKKSWAIAMGGAYVMIINMDIENTAVSDLEDCGRLVSFMESTNFNEMAPHDELKYVGTEYVLAHPGECYIAYASSLSGNIGLKNMTEGIYDFKWFDVVNSNTVFQEDIFVYSGNQSWNKPVSIGNELAVYIKKNDINSTLTPTQTTTFTITATPTQSSTQTATNTSTQTQTQTQTATPTLTVIATETSTATFTNTSTPTKTSTTTPTITITATPTQSSTQTATNTPTQTQTATPTLTVTATETSTATFTNTSTPTKTLSKTVTKTTTKTTTPTQSSTQTPTNTPMQTQTATPTLTVIATETSTATFTNTATPTLTVTNTLTPIIPTKTPMLTITKTLTPIKITPTLTITKTATITFTSTYYLPTLTDGKVNPTFGDQDTEFNYFVFYEDQDGGSPPIKRVIINEEIKKMELYSGEPWQGTYIFTILGVELKNGINDFYFQFSDDENNPVRLPEEGSFDGPNVDVGTTLTPKESITITQIFTQTPNNSLTQTPKITATPTDSQPLDGFRITAPSDFYFNTVILSWTPVINSDYYRLYFFINNKLQFIELKNNYLTLSAQNEIEWSFFVNIGTIYYVVYALDDEDNVIEGPTDVAYFNCYFNQNGSSNDFITSAEPGYLTLSSPSEFYYNTIILSWAPIEGASTYKLKYRYSTWVFEGILEDNYLRIIISDPATWDALKSIGTIYYSVAAIDSEGYVIDGPTGWEGFSCK